MSYIWTTAINLKIFIVIIDLFMVGHLYYMQLIDVSIILHECFVIITMSDSQMGYYKTIVLVYNEIYLNGQDIF